MNNYFDIVEKIYSNSMDSRRKIHHLIEVSKYKNNLLDISFYAKRHLIAGVSKGRIYNHKTTGPCFLPSVDIKKLNKSTELDKLMEKQPTFQNVFTNCVMSEGIVHVCMETKEYTNLISELTGNKQEDIFDKVIEISNKIKTYNKKLIKLFKPKNEVIIHNTYESKVDNTISEYTEKYADNYIDFINTINPPLALKIKKAKDKKNIYALRVAVTYLPGWWGDKNVKSHTIVENVFHNGPIFGILNSKSSFVGICPPKSIDGKLEMDNGKPIYLGKRKYVDEALKELKSKLPLKTPYACPVGNLVLFCAENKSELDLIPKCANNPIRSWDNKCKYCYQVVRDMLEYIVE